MLGDEVYATMANKALFGNAWPSMSQDQQMEIIFKLQHEEDPAVLRKFLSDEHGLSEEQFAEAEKASRMLPEGYGRLGLKATSRVIEQLKRYLDDDGEVITYDRAVKLGIERHHSDERKDQDFRGKLPYYGEVLSRHIPPSKQQTGDREEIKWGKITNPTVHIGLRQLEKVVNEIIKRHGRPDEIVVELARELKLNEKDKKEHNRRIRRDTAAAVLRSTKLQELGIPDTGANRALLRAWEELNPANPLDRRCAYCGEMISGEMLFNGSADIDHIIPYSRSLDDSASNRIVAHRHCNRAKGNRTPHEKWRHDGERWELIAAQVARLHKSKQWRFGPDAMARVEKDGGFIARQLTDTQYLSRLARKYLSSLYPTKDEGSVWVIPGRMTAMLRRLWGLNSLLPDHNFVENEHSNAPKNRLDHRHHAIDAAVVAVTTRSRMQEIAHAAARAESKDLDRLFEDLEQPWKGFREELGEKLAGVTVSHKPDHGRKGKPAPGRDVTAGRLHNDTAYGFTGELAADGKTPIVVHRVPLMSLKPADLTNPERIPDPVLRHALYRATEGLNGKDYERALAKFSKEGAQQRDRNGKPLFQNIRRVRVCEPLTVIPISDKNGRAYKAYAGSSNDRYNVWKMPDGAWKCDVVPTFDAHQRGYVEKRPHPAAKKVLSLRQNDLIAVERNGGPREIMRVIKFTLNGQMAIVAHNEGGKLAERHKNPDDSLTIINPTATGLKNMKARQVRIDPLGRIFDPGPR